MRSGAIKSRLAVIGAVVVFLASCSDSTEPSQSSTSAPPTTKVEYTLSPTGSLDEVVDLAERSPTDDFYYVVSRAGTIQKWSVSRTSVQTVLDISSLISAEGERGLLGLAFRKVGSQWFAYLNHTDRDGNTQIVEYIVRNDGTFDVASRRSVMSIEQPYSNHNGGGVAIGPDNMLYIGMGDGGAGGDPERRARKLSSLLGKILRIDPTPTSSQPYTIPTDNPYVGVSDARGEIWSIGLRNPWRFSFDSDGNLWIADVGQNKWEEVNVSRRTAQTLAGRGIDYGWSAFEGTHRYNEDEPAQAAMSPIFEYSHSDGNCSISGSAVATPDNLPLRTNWYFFGDFCSGRVTALHVDANNRVQTETVAKNAGNVTGLRSISKGVFILTLDGTISRITTTRS